jgi:choline dehydrogenase
MRVSDLASPNPLSKAFVQAAKQAGFPPNEDFAGPTQRGFGLFQVTQRSGRRESAATAFLEPAVDRPNLTVRTRARVTGLQWEGTRCVGVTYRRDGASQRVSADAEVIVSAGAINSPQLLMLSGVGPADDLAEFDIDPVVDLPGVGRNLQDHPVAFLCQVCTQPVSLAAAESATNLAKYLAGGTGMLTSNVGEAGGFIHSGEDDGAIPDIQFHFAPAYFIEHGRVEPPGHGFTIGPTLVMPHSRGYIALRSADPFDAPTVEPRYLADERDGTRLVRGLEIARRIAAAPAFDRYRGAEYLPGRRADDPAALLGYIRRSLETLYHPAGTCKMATADDPEAVVDPELRVHGTEGLRVVDASIMPTLVNANTHAPTTMIAERAADLIRHEQ